MSKKIVVFSDGTGNSAAKIFKTNVWRTYQALDLSEADQIAMYDDGVGTSSFRPYAYLGGGFGIGLARNVKELYAFISRNYEPGDRIYAFGFSRGAFTIRVLTGLIACGGLLPKASRDGTPMPEGERRRLVNSTYRAFRKQFDPKGGSAWIFRALRDLIVDLWTRLRGHESHDDLRRQRRYVPVEVEFLGLWDTVDAYGLPIEEMTRAWDQWFWPLSMREQNLSTIVKRACHALALDDERATFHPVLWNEAKEPQDAAHIDEERISQVWFSGMHANLGGGYADDSLSYVSLEWMLDEARKAGLRFDRGVFGAVQASAAAALRFKSASVLTLHDEATPFGRLYDSRHGLASYYRYLPRKLSILTRDRAKGRNEVLIKRPKIHWSVFERIKNGGDNYAPIVLPERYAVVMSDGSIREHVYESSSQASARARAQEAVWNLVWVRRALYFATVFASVVFALVPWGVEAHADGSCVGPTCVVAPLIGAIGMFLPALAAPWVAAYRSNPGVFLIMGAVLASLMTAGSLVQARITDSMRPLWAQVVVGRIEDVRLDSFPSDTVYRLRTHRLYQRFFRVLKNSVLPIVFALLFACAFVVVVSRVIFSGRSAFGDLCAGSDSPLRVTVDRTVQSRESFDTSHPCWPSGIQLREGARYRIQLVKSDAWMDSGLPAGLHGTAETDLPFVMRLAAVFRRDLGQAWFQPIARIGRTGDDEYPLLPAVPDPDQDEPDSLVSEITARTSGELFLFVNDAVPFGSTRLYGNNRGSAAVWVHRLAPPTLPPPAGS